MEALFQWISKEEQVTKRILPKGFIWGTLALSIILSVIVLVESTFSKPELSRLLTESPHITENSLLYIIAIAFSIATALFLNCLTLANYYAKKNVSTAIIGLAFLCAALYNGIDLLDHGVEILTGAHLSSGIYARWLVSQTLHAVLLLLGSLIVLRYGQNGKHVNNRKSTLLIRVSVLFAALLILAVYLTPESTLSLENNHLLSHPLALIPLTLYIGWGLVVLPSILKQHKSLFAKSVALTLLPAALGASFMATHQLPFDNRFNVAYFLTMLTYSVPLLGIALDYFDLIRNEKRIVARLDSEIHKRTRTQQMLEKREALLKSAEQISGLGSWELDTETTEVTWSDGMYRIFGYRVDAFRPSIVLHEKLTGPEFREAVKNAILTAIRKKGSYSIEYEVVRADGKRRSVLGQGQFIPNGSRLVGTVLDITELKNVNRKLAQSEALLKLKVEELNRSNAELEQFAYVASHDLQEPLRKIRAFGDRVAGKFSASLPSEGQDYLSRMTDAAQRMQVLIEDLLAFSRLTRANDNFVPVNLAAVADIVLNDLEHLVDSKQAQLRVNLPDTIEGIPAQIRQLFQNLISNALKFTRPGIAPVVEVSSSTIPGSDGPDFLAPEKKYCLIHIRDNGIGFDPQYSDKIFVLFQRLHSRSEYSGTGIGLAICKKIVENHHGIIKAQSAEGLGAAFTIFLPVK